MDPTEANDSANVDSDELADAFVDHPEDAPKYESDMMRAKRQHGLAGAILAGGMFALDQVLGRKPREQPAAVQEFSGEPHDIDADGIKIALDEHTTVVSPAPHLREGTQRVVRRRRRGNQ